MRALNYFKFNYFKSSYFKCIVALLTLSASTGFAASGDDEFLLARDAYSKKNAIALSEFTQQLQDEHYILAPYAEYWLMLLSLNEADNKTIVDFINTYSDYPFSAKLRAEYLKKLGKEQDWSSFATEYARYKQEDAAVACYAAEANAVLDDVKSLQNAKALWMQAKEQPSNCNSLFDRMQVANVLTEEDIWGRFRLALTDNRISLAKGILQRSKTFEASQNKLIDKVMANPSAALTKRTIGFNTRLGRELNLTALNRVAKTNSLQALSLFNKLADSIQTDDKKFFYGRLALYAAQRHEPQAQDWFKLASNDGKTNGLNNDQMAWYARAALRDKNWKNLLAVIEKMDATQSEEAAWRYWKARALKTQNQTLEANTLFAKLSVERHFYGWLAQDELEGFVTAPLNTYKTSEADVKAIAAIPAIQRAQALQGLDFLWEAKAEWVMAIQAFDDSQLIAAAEFASRQKWHDLAIITADKTTELHDFALRYPTPYRNLMKSAANDQAIDEAWVYGITRQESRFMVAAKSGVGAAGLMQLMPATAKWIASKAGVENYHNGMIHEMDTNIALGTYYLRYTLDLMNGQPVMATAAYNAGPSRARKWQADVPLEGAIYAETIPFSETRTYVQRVMANAHLYAHQLGLKPITLKQRLGIIPSNTGLISDNAGVNSAAVTNVDAENVNQNNATQSNIESTPAADE
ncbi:MULTISPECIES: lytic transglycosylase domain-containing protein [Methylotenera]|uniref:lytic transglycosylase domain-containing protein n=1 Tax=Methylotenera TaxID=359407 RepID=UPI0003698AD4|nr:MULTISPECIES: lytic transglycosylase domain-containing protein [Methylotenera]